MISRSYGVNIQRKIVDKVLCAVRNSNVVTSCFTFSVQDLATLSDKC